MNRTPPKLPESKLRKLRAHAAREYSTHEDARRIYRDGFTEGWLAYAAALEDAELCKCRSCVRAAKVTAQPK